MQYFIVSFRDLEFVIDAARDRPIQAADILKGGFADTFIETSTNQTAKRVQNAIQRGDMNVARALVQEDIGAIVKETMTRRKGRQEELKAQRLATGAVDQHAWRRICQQIPKTIVYMDSISHIELARQQIIGWLVKYGCSITEAKHVIKVYYSELTDSNKLAISSEFVKPDSNELLSCSHYRVILATDAMGMGINNPDIKRVV